MGQYTETMMDMAKISSEDDNYVEELEEAKNNFRNFDDALDNFIVENGYRGEVNDIKAKIAYIQSRFELASVDLIEPRSLRNWFSLKESPIKRKLLFRFCFAFQLSIEESNDFFRKVCLQRGFDCHDINEAVYYYAISHQLSYQETEMLINEVPKVEKDKISPDNVLYTNSIVEEFNMFKNSDELLRFFRDNYNQFGYNNATAYKYIETIWKSIQDVQGLADKEKIRLICVDCENENRCIHIDVHCDDCEKKR